MKKIILLLLCVYILSSCSISQPVNNLINENSNSNDNETYKNTSEKDLAFDEKSDPEKTNVTIQKFSEQFDITTELERCPSSIDDEDYNSFYSETEWMVSKETTWPNSEAPIAVKSNSAMSIEGKYAENFPIVDNSIALEDILYLCDGQTIMGDLFFSEYQYKTYVNTYDRTIQDSENMLDYPIVTMRKIGNGKYYDVRKYRYGGYLYTFYDRVYDANTGQYISDDETLISEIGGVYLEEVLSYDDFSELKIGDHIDEVEKIDSAIGIYKIYSKLDEASAGAYGNDDLRIDYQINKTTSLHILTDGLLSIYYEKINGEYYISNMIYSEDFIYEPPYIKDRYGYSYPKQFKILPQDYPPAS